MDTPGSPANAAAGGGVFPGGRVRRTDAPPMPTRKPQARAPQARAPQAEAPASVRLPGQPLDFGAIVVRFETPLLRYVRQLFGNDGESSEEVVQEAFLRLHRQLEQHGAASVENLSSWLFRVAHNLTISTLRRRELERELREQICREAPGASLHPADALDEMVRREMCDMIMAELRSLPDDQKQVLLLKVIQGFTLREISDVTDIALSSVSYRINQGLRELARRLKSQGLV